MKNLPNNPDFDHLRGQAKSLLREWRAANPLDSRKLADAQHTLAVEYGFETWAALKQHVAAVMDSGLPIDDWVKKAMTQRVVGPPPAEADRRDFVVALCVANLDAVKSFLADDPTLAGQSCGVFSCGALCYLCGSMAVGGDRVAVARLLIESGADVNATWEDPNWPGSPLAPLYGACGKLYDAELARLLLESGAIPDDNESLYHSTESPDSSCLRVLLDHGATVNGFNALYRALDFDHLDHVQLLLGRGADPNDTKLHETPIHHAIRRGRGVPYLKALVSAGARLDTKSKDGLTLLQNARLRSGADVVDYLVGLGLEGSIDAVDRFVEAVKLGDESAIKTCLDADPEIGSKLRYVHWALLPEAAWQRNTLLVKRFLDNGWPTAAPEIKWFGGVHPRGPSALHVACFVGDLATAQVLVEAGADINLVESQHNSTPLEWAAWAAVNSMPESGAGQADCVQFLLEKGAILGERWPRGNDEIDELIEAAIESRRS